MVVVEAMTVDKDLQKMWKKKSGAKKKKKKEK